MPKRKHFLGRLSLRQLQLSEFSSNLTSVNLTLPTSAHEGRVELKELRRFVWFLPALQTVIDFCQTYMAISRNLSKSSFSKLLLALLGLYQRQHHLLLDCCIPVRKKIFHIGQIKQSKPIICFRQLTEMQPILIMKASKTLVHKTTQRYSLAKPVRVLPLGF